jgi:DNA repair protein RecN (Recombination protein N)
LISTNLGQPFKPLKEIVSGGELSRTMFAIKLITKNINDIPTLIFDEIDTGISGFTANIIGKKLKDISRDLQIIAITHLPQIAAFSDHHISVVKVVDEKNNKSISKLTILDEIGKADEIAKLISGKVITNSSIKSAKELIRKSLE